MMPSTRSFEGPLRTAEYDKMICDALLAAFGKRTINSAIKMYEAVRIQVNGWIRHALR